MNNSIYLMLAVPYSAVLVVGYMIYRGMKKNQEYLKAQQESPFASVQTESAN